VARDHAAGVPPYVPARVRLTTRPAAAKAYLTGLARDTARALRGHDLALYAAGVTFYAAVAVVPSLLVAVRAAAALVGGEQVRDYADRLAEALPDALGAPEAARAVLVAGVELSWLGVLVAVLPATLYGEGMRRAFGALSDDRDTLVGWQGRLRAVPLLAAAPVLLLAVLAVTPLLARLFGSGDPLLGALGVYVALNVDWIVVGVALTYVYRVVGPRTPSWRAALGAGLGVGAFVSGFLQGFVLFLAIPVDLGAPFGGFVGIGAMVAVAGWLWIFHVLVLVGYRLTLQIDARSAAGDAQRPAAVQAAGR
jgi:membrane protein